MTDCDLRLADEDAAEVVVVVVVVVVVAVVDDRVDMRRRVVTGMQQALKAGKLDGCRLRTQHI